MGAERLHDWLFTGDTGLTDRPLFVDLGNGAELERTRVIDAPGVTHLRFRVAKQGS
jgi:hypothetical protein